jgi:hypothetical protein
MRPLNLLMVRILCGVLVSLTATQAWAAIAWDESVNGDLSNDRLNPTSIDLSSGINSLIAKVGLGGDLDFVTIHVPANAFLSGLTMVSYTGPDGTDPEDGTAFIGMEAGNQVTVSSSFSAAGLMGWAHFGPFADNVGSNILPSMNTTFFGSSGFTIPVASGAYSFWIQQLSDVEIDYQFDFQITTGDYNGNHIVDAADYTVWRDSLGLTVAVGSGADGDGSTIIDTADYTLWKNQFGSATPGAGSGTSAAVPEPSAIFLALFGVFSVIGLGPKRRRAR